MSPCVSWKPSAWMSWVMSVMRLLNSWDPEAREELSYLLGGGNYRWFTFISIKIMWTVDSFSSKQKKAWLKACLANLLTKYLGFEAWSTYIRWVTTFCWMHRVSKTPVWCLERIQPHREFQKKALRPSADHNLHVLTYIPSHSRGWHVAHAAFDASKAVS